MRKVPQWLSCPRCGGYVMELENFETINQQMKKCFRDNMDLKSEILELTHLMLFYARHRPDCAQYENSDANCDCDYDKCIKPIKDKNQYMVRGFGAKHAAENDKKTAKKTSA